MIQLGVIVVYLALLVCLGLSANRLFRGTAKLPELNRDDLQNHLPPPIGDSTNSVPTLLMTKTSCSWRRFSIC